MDEILNGYYDLSDDILKSDEKLLRFYLTLRQGLYEGLGIEEPGMILPGARCLCPD